MNGTWPGLRPLLHQRTSPLALTIRAVPSGAHSTLRAADGTACGHIFLDIDRNDPTIGFDCSDPTPVPITVQSDGTLALRLPHPEDTRYSGTTAQPPGSWPFL